jgi:hypothetical protein
VAHGAGIVSPPIARRYSTTSAASRPCG